jgi:hypothetical protein
MALVIEGRNYMANAVIANPSVLFNVTTATIAVGSSATAYTDTDGDMLGTAAYAVVSTAPTIATNVLTFVTTFGTGVANFNWNEWGIVNSTGVSPTGAHTLLNRKVEDLGTKTTAQSWEITCTLTVDIGT